MSQTFEQYLHELRERAIDDGDARPRARAFASNARYIVGEGRTRDELQVTCPSCRQKTEVPVND